MKKIIFIIILFFIFSGCYVANSGYQRRYLNIDVVYPNYYPYYNYYYYSHPPRKKNNIHYHNHHNNHHYGPRK